MSKHLHIICLTVPYPVNYGGVYDLFYKLEALRVHGVSIHLHCFDYGRGKQPVLDQYCASVNYYERNTGYRTFTTSMPYIVSSRKNEELLNNLLKDDYPILMEGVHCTSLLMDKRFANRKTIVRLHNVEYLYYKSLSASAGGFFKKLYFVWESYALKKYEKKLAATNTTFVTVSHDDREIYNTFFKAQHVSYLPLFVPVIWQVQGLAGMGAYCLYHGDLSVGMNEKAAVWLIKLFAGMKIPLVVAGKAPSNKLQKLATKYEQTCVIANPDAATMQDMVTKAHINILPSFSSTGIKIKLLNALFNGRHCIVNSATVLGSGLEDLCHITDTDEAMRQRIEALYHQPFTQQELSGRKQILSTMFNNTLNAEKLAAIIWD